MNNYGSLQDATQGILCEAVKIARSVNYEFLVIGGWSPFFLNNKEIKHPGTRDVDLLFKKGRKPGELKLVINAFLNAGYLSSAKHQFQLLRTAKVGDREFIFNVDLLHHTPHEKEVDMFVDHLELIDEDEDEDTVLYQYQSIVVPMSSILFENACSVLKHVDAVLPDGMPCGIEIPLMNELGTLITKAKCMSNEKRQRDSFDIMVAILQARDVKSLSKSIREHKLADRLQPLMKITEESTYRRNIFKYHPVVEDEESLWSTYKERLNAFFVDSSISN